MRTPLLVLMTLALLAGCTAEETTTGPDGQDTHDTGPTGPNPTPPNTPGSSPSGAPSANPGAPALTVPEKLAVLNDTVTFAVSTSTGILLEAEAEPGTVQVTLSETTPGNWTVTASMLAHGHTVLTFTADNGHASTQANTTVARWMQVTVEVRYKGAPGATDRTDVVLFDPMAFASAPAYEGQTVAHPGHATVHDAMVEWTEDTGVAVAYDYHPTFAYAVRQIGGIGAPVSGLPAQAWCYEINGSSAPLGISTMAVTDGDVMTWNLGCA